MVARGVFGLLDIKELSHEKLGAAVYALGSLFLGPASRKLNLLPLLLSAKPFELKSWILDLMKWSAYANGVLKLKYILFCLIALVFHFIPITRMLVIKTFGGLLSNIAVDQGSPHRL
jgi:hypothetical protein